MKQKTVYICEGCGREYAMPHDAQACEADHYWLTYEEYKQWERLHKAAAATGRTIGITKNEETGEAFTKACQELAEFVSAHGLEEQKVPQQFYF